MKKIITVTIIIALIAIGCSKKNNPSDSNDQNNSNIGEPILSDYLSLSIGHSWTYTTSTINYAGQVNPNSTGSTVVKLIQKDVLIGGQPHAFIMQVTNNESQPNNMAFFVDDKTLFNYLGDKSVITLPTMPIYWAPSTLSGVKVNVNQSQLYTIIDASVNTSSFSIKRSQNSSIALATMSASAVLQITGVSAGNTTLALQKIGGTEQDTMTVLIEVGATPRPIGPPYSSWMPIWQLTKSTAGEIMYLWDTTYSFKRCQNHSLCTERMIYKITNRYIGQENITAAQISVPCDKFEMKITMTETIDTNSVRVFDGYSTENTLTMWLAKGWGFIKGLNNGNSLSLTVIYGGTMDSSGALHGYFISPRVSYLSVGPLQTDFFTIDQTPLATNSSSSLFLLRSKNFSE